jgi:hypothetical protein
MSLVYFFAAELRIGGTFHLPRCFPTKEVTSDCVYMRMCFPRCLFDEASWQEGLACSLLLLCGSKSSALQIVAQLAIKYQKLRTFWSSIKSDANERWKSLQGCYQLLKAPGDGLRLLTLWNVWNAVECCGGVNVFLSSELLNNSRFMPTHMRDASVFGVGGCVKHAAIVGCDWDGHA